MNEVKKRTQEREMPIPSDRGGHPESRSDYSAAANQQAASAHAANAPQEQSERSTGVAAAAVSRAVLSCC